jgi:hypothetical protein
MSEVGEMDDAEIRARGLDALYKSPWAGQST